MSVNSRRTASVIGALCVGIAAGGVIVGAALFGKNSGATAAQPPAPAPSRTDNAALAALRSELHTQRLQEAARLHTIEQKVDALKGASERGPAPPEGDPQLTREEMAAQVQRFEQERRAKETARQRILEATFQTAFEAESVDPAWSRSKREEIRDAFASASTAPLETSPSGVDCRSSLCRIEVKLDGAKARDALDAALENPAFSGGSYFHPGATESSRVVYVFRQDRHDQINRIFKTANAAVAEMRSAEAQ